MFSGKSVDYQDVPLANNGFWPDMNLAEFQRSRSIPADISAETAADALLAATAEVNELLASVEQKHRAAGFNAAAKVPGASMNGQNQLTAQYKKAVFARAKADLLGEFASVCRRDAHPGQESEETRSGLLAESSVVIRQIMGLRRATVRKV